MDVAAIRTDLADACNAAGYNAYSYVPGNVVSLPAAVSGVVEQYEALNAMLNRIELRVRLYVSRASIADAWRQIDAAMSTGVAGSLIDALNELPDASWRNCHVTGAENVHDETVGTKQTIAVDVLLEIIA